jgi:hypothetical protein
VLPLVWATTFYISTNKRLHFNRRLNFKYQETYAWSLNILFSTHLTVFLPLPRLKKNAHFQRHATHFIFLMSERKLRTHIKQQLDKWSLVLCLERNHELVTHPTFLTLFATILCDGNLNEFKKLVLLIWRFFLRKNCFGALRKFLIVTVLVIIH